MAPPSLHAPHPFRHNRHKSPQILNILLTETDVLLMAGLREGQIGEMDFPLGRRKAPMNSGKRKRAASSNTSSDDSVSAPPKKKLTAEKILKLCEEGLFVSLEDLKPSSYLPLHLKPYFEERKNADQDVNDADCSQCPGNSCEKLLDALDLCKVESNDVHRREQKSDNNDNEQAGRHATVEKESK